ncbi:efflux RND transporter permease subunit [Yunchengibacter salinarum]|uniref:efflux RND transporter permease subunit n=1 Tax=Yunchengibacter salinarum TaxID=3133399 RepID=UPI0035B58754
MSDEVDGKQPSASEPGGGSGGDPAGPPGPLETGGITALGVKRPVLVIVMNLLIILAGLASIPGQDVRELPNVDRPVVSVRAVFDGASPKTMDAEVTSLIEGAVARVSGVKTIESASEENNMRMRVEFDAGADLNTAASDVREAVSRVRRELPDDIDEVVVVKADDDARAIIELSAFSNSLNAFELAERIEKDVAPELLSIDGVADVRLDGNRPRVMRVQLDPARLARFGLAPGNVLDTLASVNLDVPAGSYESEDQELLVRAEASVTSPERVERLEIIDGVRIEDVAEVFFAPQEASSYSLLNGRLVVGLGVVRQAGANTIAIADAVDRRVARINSRARDFSLQKTSDDSVYIRGALSDVGWTIVIAAAVVLAIIALFLGQWRAIFIPAVTMPVALVGTLAVIWLMGFSINLLTLLALVLATGLIVDDAIVVLENIQRRRAQGLEKLAAAVLGTRQVFFAVVATTITLVSVFLPIAFLPGDTGRLFREFGMVLSIAVVISSFVAITLCPMMASRLPNLSQTNPVLARIRAGLDGFGQRLANFYFATLDGLLARRWLGVLLALALVAGGLGGFRLLNQELLPQEDRGAIRVFLTGPDGASLAYSDRQAQKVEAALRPYREQGVVTDIYTIVGRWDKNRSYTIATLKHWDDRNVSQQALAVEINEKLSDLPGADVRIIQGSSLNVRGGGAGLDVAITGNDYETIYAQANMLARVLRERIPAVEGVRVQFDTSQPELAFNIDRDRAADLGVPIDTVSRTLRVMVDRLDLLDLNVDDQAVPVMVGPMGGTITEPGDLLNIFVPGRDGAMVPLSALVTVTERGVAAELDRKAQRRAIDLDVGVKPGAALGDVVNRVRAVADDVLPSGTNVLFSGEASRLEETRYETGLTFIVALAVVFLVLAAQFESFGSAAIVMVTVPFGLAAAVFALLITGQTLNLYSQIGLVMLIGLMTKNAILLVEFMDQLRDEGQSVADAIRGGVRLRLRPVIMTVLSTVLGSLPLVLSTGPGAEARNAIGWVVFGGLGLSTLFTLYLAPIGYSLIAPMVKPRSHGDHLLARQLAHARLKEES